MTFQISLEDSVRFAALSGDFNPLHLSPLASRRSPFGSSVVHGAHATLKALLDDSRNQNPEHSLARLAVWFREPIAHNAAIEVVVTSQDELSLKMELKDGQKTCQVIAATFSPRQDLPVRMLPSRNFDRAEAQNLSLAELDGVNQSTPLRFDETLAKQTFGCSVLSLPAIQIAQLMAISRIVGMECPGLHSTLTQLSMDFQDHDDDAETSEPVMHYQAKLVSSMLSKIRLSVQSLGLQANVESLYRPPPIEQPSVKVIAKQISPREFANRQCLVIGGSRGLGEVAAKILAAGGASVGLTYHSGQDDANKVCEEIREAGYDCHYMEWNVLDPPVHRPPSPDDWQPDSVFYFATPHIGLTKSNVWQDERFTKFCDYYVRGFVRSVETARNIYHNGDSRLSVFYPSTVLLDTPGLLAAEYAAAKAASESVCEFLGSLPGVYCYRTRLPRILTDQTNSFVAAAAEDATTVLLSAFREMQRLAPEA